MYVKQPQSLEVAVEVAVCSCIDTWGRDSSAGEHPGPASRERERTGNDRSEMQLPHKYKVSHTISGTIVMKNVKTKLSLKHLLVGCFLPFRKSGSKFPLGAMQ